MGGILGDLGSGLSGIVSGLTNVTSALGSAVVGSGGVLNILMSGSTSSATISSGGKETLSSGGTATGTVISNGGTLTVSSGGTASATVVSSGGVEVISSGGTDKGTTIKSGGSEKVVAGTASATVVGSGGSMTISGGQAVGTVVNGGGVVTLSGGTASGTIVSSGGKLVVSAGGTATGLTLIQGGAVDLASVAFASGGTVTLNSVTDVLTIVEGGHSATLQLSGAYPGEFFHLASDGAGGTLITEDKIPCFLRGTLIRTAADERPVEALRIGDLIATMDGETLPLKWIGRRSYRDWLAVGNSDVQPILFKAGSIADGVPARDLHVSPEHAMLVDGVLVPACHLVNGVSVMKLSGLEEVEYFHLEFDRHVVILAEGAPTESFVDDESRMLFHNEEEYRRLYPNEVAPRFAAFCAPRVEEGPALDAIRRSLAARAAHLRAGGVAAPWGRRGKVELATGKLVAGWAFSGADAGPVPLAILVNGAVVGRIVADRYRADLEAAGIGDGHHGFSFVLPKGLAKAIDHRIEVRREVDWSLL